jgi:hypothetical protein
VTSRRVFSLPVALAVFALFLGTLRASPPVWSVLVSTNTPTAWFTVGTYSSQVGFAEMEAPNGAIILAGSVISITNATATLSNGTLNIIAKIDSNSLNQIAAMSATNLPLNLKLVDQ